MKKQDLSYLYAESIEAQYTDLTNTGVSAKPTSTGFAAGGSLFWH